MMAEEVTPEDIEKIYEKEESRIITKILLSSIDKINETLKRKYEDIVTVGWVRFSAIDLKWPAPSQKWKNIGEHLSDFYTSWDIEVKWIAGGFYLYFSPKKIINKKVKIDMSTIKKTEIIAPDEEVSNRADILDL